MILNKFLKVISIIRIILYKKLFKSRFKINGIGNIDLFTRFFLSKNSSTLIGKCFYTRHGVSIRNDCGTLEIGNNVFVNENASINCRKFISIGNNVLIAQNVLIFDHDHDYKNNIKNFIEKEIIIEDNVWIGAGCIILKGVHIGKNSVIAAGCLITKNIPENSILFQERKNHYKVIEKRKDIENES